VKRKLLLLVLAALPLLTMCSWPDGPMMGNWDRTGNYGCGFGFGYGYGGMFMGIIFLLVLAAAIYFVVQAIRTKNVAGRTEETPLDIIKKRYAKGELTKEDFERMKNELQ